MLIGMSGGKFATTINCMDGRVQIPVINYMKEKYHVDYVDVITQPGVNKILSEKDQESIVESIKNNLKISIYRHNSKVVAIVGHYDCAANPVNEGEHKKQIKKAVEAIETWGLKVKVVGLWLGKEWIPEEVK